MPGGQGGNLFFFVSFPQRLKRIYDEGRVINGICAAARAAREAGCCLAPSARMALSRLVTSRPNPVRHDLTADAIRVARLIRTLLPEDGETAGLLALMLLTEVRRTARVSASGELIPSTSRTAGPETRH